MSAPKYQKLGRSAGSVTARADEPEHEEGRGEQRLGERARSVGVAHPLPLEVQPPHPDLLAESTPAGRSSVRLAVLAAVEVVHERVVASPSRACTTARACVRQPVGSPSLTAGKYAARIGCVANGLSPDERRGDAREHEPRAQHRRAADRTSTASASAPARQHARHVVGVAEAAEIRDQNEPPVGERARRVARPTHGEPRHDRDARERNRVDLLVHDRLVPHRERGRADHRASRGADDPRRARAKPTAQDVLGDQEPAARGSRARRPRRAR